MRGARPQTHERCGASRGRLDSNEMKRSKNTKRISIFGPAILGLVVFALAGCSERQSDSIQVKLGEQVIGATVPVETLALTRHEYEESFEAPGTVEAGDEVTVSAEFAARIVDLRLDIGDEVERGDVLLKLDDSQVLPRIRKIEAMIRRARIVLDDSSKDLDRQKSLFETDIASESTLDDAQRMMDTYSNDLDSAQADLEIARVDLERCTVRAPISGSIAERHSSIGEYVTPGVKLFDLVGIEEVKFVCALSERDIIRVKPGDRMAVSIDAHEGREFDGILRAIAPSGRRATRTFRIEIVIDNPPPHSLLPGMSGTADIVRHRFDDVIIVPEDAIVAEGGSTYVFVDDQASARRREVQVISRFGARAAVSGELGVDRDLVILGQYAIHEGTALSVRRRHEEIPESKFD